LKALANLKLRLWLNGVAIAKGLRLPWASGGKKVIVQRFIYQAKSKQIMIPVQTNAKGKISYFFNCCDTCLN
jgi:hypothetical protein